MTDDELISEVERLAEKAKEYLAHGGLFNPEAMNHGHVRDMVVDLNRFVANHATTLAARLREVLAENERLRAALQDIAKPISSYLDWSQSLRQIAIAALENRT